MADGNTQHARERSVEQPLSRLHFGFGRRLPVILQTEAAECGLACLTMISRFYGHDVDLPSLRRRFSMSLKGANLAHVMDIAKRLDFDTRPVRLELEELAELQVPCILHWDLNHFVVLKRVTRRFAEIHDPARGVRRLSMKVVSDAFTGVALDLSPTVDFQPVKARESISVRSLTGRTRGLARALGQILLLSLALEVFTLVAPFYMQWVIDQALVSADRDLLTLLGVGFVMVTVFRATVSAARSWSVASLSARLNVQWVSNVVGHMLRLPLAWFEKRHIGDIMSRFNSLHTIQQTFTMQFIGSLLDGLMSIVTLLIMGFYSLPLMLLVFGLFALYGVLRWVFFRPLRRAQEDQIIYRARQQSELLETVRGILPIKLADMGSERQARYANRLVDAVNRQLIIQRLGISFSSINQLLFGVGRVALIWAGALMALRGAFTVGMLVAFIAYADQFVSRGTALIDKLVDFGMLRLHAERLADITQHAPESSGVNPAGGVSLRDASVEVRGLGFRYGEGEPWIFRHLSFRIEAGQSLAIVGPSGSGKTTLAKVILGLMAPTEGEVLFGGVNIRDLGIENYRRLVGAVMQDDQLFAGSIADNIAFFDPDMHHVQVEAAARLAALHAEIAAMPMGYQTLVGDMGSSLSGGQVQRVILARAIYRDPRLLILDEATSHLDAACQARVDGAVSSMKATRIVITHRKDTISSSDKVFSMSYNNCHIHQSGSGSGSKLGRSNGV